MAFYQVNREMIRSNPDLSRKSIYVSTGGTPTNGQIRGMLTETPAASHFLCFDNDAAGRSFVERFKTIAQEMNIAPDRIKVFPMLPCYKDWNDVLLERTNPEYLKEIEGLIEPVGVPHSEEKEENSRNNGFHR